MQAARRCQPRHGVALAPPLARRRMLALGVRGGRPMWRPAGAAWFSDAASAAAPPPPPPRGRQRVRALLSAPPEPEAEVVVMGWLRSVRFQKKRAFAHLDDGSLAAGLQVLLKPETTQGFDSLRAELSTGASVRVTGSVQPSPAKGQDWELVATGVELVGACDDTYPLQKKWHSPEFLRGVAHLRPRTRGGGAVARVRSALALSTHEFFGQRGFLHVHTPILTGCDAEGGGETFEVLPSQQAAASLSSTGGGGESGGGESGGGGGEPSSSHFFGQRTYLTVSGQLHGEALALAHGDVYVFGPCFRAEASHTSRHLAELWMIEPEMAWANLDDAISLAEDYCKTTLSSLLANHADDLELLQSIQQQQQAEEEEQSDGFGLMREIEGVCGSDPWTQITYTEAVAVLQDAEARQPGRFDQPLTCWGDDLGSEHERYLCSSVGENKPLVVRDYPAEGKAFYMRRNEDGRTVAAMDVLFPRLAEVVGGGQREERLPILLSNLQAQQQAQAQQQQGEGGGGADSLNLNDDQMEWYSDLRRYGSVPHAGWGAGFDRLVQFATGKDNIRDVVPFPRTRGTAIA